MFEHSGRIRELSCSFCFLVWQHLENQGSLLFQALGGSAASQPQDARVLAQASTSPPLFLTIYHKPLQMLSKQMIHHSIAWYTRIFHPHLHCRPNQYLIHCPPDVALSLGVPHHRPLLRRQKFRNELRHQYLRVYPVAPLAASRK